MKQKDKLLYEAPTAETLEVKSEGVVCASPYQTLVPMMLIGTGIPGAPDYFGDYCTWDD